MELVEVARRKPCNNNKMVDKVEIAKAKALKAKEIAARKAEEVAKALAAAEAAHKLEERSTSPRARRPSAGASGCGAPRSTSTSRAL